MELLLLLLLLPPAAHTSGTTHTTLPPQEHFKLNIECNHATLAGHSCEHELRVASLAGLLGNIDANSGGRAQPGWRAA